MDTTRIGDGHTQNAARARVVRGAEVQARARDVRVRVDVVVQDLEDGHGAGHGAEPEQRRELEEGVLVQVARPLRDLALRVGVLPADAPPQDAPVVLDAVPVELLDLSWKRKAHTRE